MVFIFKSLPMQCGKSSLRLPLRTPDYCELNKYTGPSGTLVLLVTVCCPIVLCVVGFALPICLRVLAGVIIFRDFSFKCI